MLPTFCVMGLLLVLALLIDLIGFKRFVFFLNIGYAFSIVAMALAVGGMYFNRLGWFSALHLAGLLFWGLRLGFFLVQRELLPSYLKESEAIQAQYGGIKRPLQVLIWVVVSLLYVFMFSPGLYHATNSAVLPEPASSLFQWAGLVLIVFSQALEGLADRQKSAFKLQHPKDFCSVGLYRWVRCPNYLGEILFWLGSWVMGIPFYTSIFEWAASLVGLVCIILIMMGSTKRLEASQQQRYGSRPDYQAYIRSVPVLFPFVPVYTLRNVRVFLE